MGEHEQAAAPIVWYGERGIINALVIALQRQGISEWHALLGAIEWADRTPRDWIDQIQSVVPLVEVGLAGFGDPDLMLVLTSKGHGPRLLFLEAKVVSYASSAMSNRDNGMAHKGFNSAINGQLALRYRFAHALEEWDGTSPLREPAGLHSVYRNDLSDPAPQPRQLQKAEVRQILRDHGLSRLPLRSCFFVALTWDEKPFFDDPCRDTWPRLLNPQGACVFEETRSQIGWLGYGQLERISKVDADYCKACTTMLPRLTPPQSFEGGRPIETKNLGSFTDSIKARVHELVQLARVAGFEITETKTGGVSVKRSGKVKVKLLPREVDGAQDVWLGVSAAEHPELWIPDLAEVRTIQRQPFRFMKLPTERERALEVAETIYEHLQARRDDRDT